MIDFDGLVIGPCVGVFGEPVVYTEPGHQSQAVAGVFDRVNLELEPMGGGRGQEPMSVGAAGNVTARKSVLGVQVSQFHAEPVKGATVVLPMRHLTYVVTEVRLDGRGGALLELKLVANPR